MSHVSHGPHGVAMLLGLVVATVALGADGGASADRSSMILGEWRGTSTCVDRQLAPACNDETVRYLFTPSPSHSGTIHLNAYKLVNRKFELMYEIDLTYASNSAAWIHEFETRQHKAQWRYTIDDHTLSGGLFDQPTGTQIRKVVATRWKRE
jgi:hypothetical protein